MRRVTKYLLLTALPLGTLIIFLYVYSVDIATWDAFAFTGSMLKKLDTNTLTFRDFLSHWNEHRIVLGKIILFLNIIYNGWNIYYELAINVLFAIGTSIIVYRAIERLGNLSAIKRATIYFISAWIIFSLSQSANWFSGFQMQILMCVFFAVWSIYLLAYSNNNSVLMSMILAILATFSFGNGMIVWLSGGVLLFRYFTDNKSAKIWLILFWLLAGVISIYLYFYGLNYPISEAPQKIVFWLTHPYVPAYLCLTYLGAPLALGKRSLALVAGSVGVGIQLYYLFKTYRNWNRNKIFWIGADIFVIFSALMTAWGRSETTSATMAGRYFSISMLFWVVTVCMSFMLAEDINLVSFKWYLAALILVCSLSVSDEQIFSARGHRDRMNEFKSQMAAGVFNESTFFWNILPFRRAALYIPLFRKYGLKNYENAPEKIVFNDFRPVSLDNLQESDVLSLDIDRFEIDSQDEFLYIECWATINASEDTRLNASIIFYDDENHNAFLASLRPYKVGPSPTWGKPYKVLDGYTLFKGDWLHYGELPKGTYDVVLQFTDKNGTYHYKMTQKIPLR